MASLPYLPESLILHNSRIKMALYSHRLENSHSPLLHQDLNSPLSQERMSISHSQSGIREA